MARKRQEPTITADGGPPSPLAAALARHPVTVVLICFFISGATGLIYEVLWSRRLTLVFGVTVLAVSTVLAAFMGGLALGSALFGRVADRVRAPLRLYAGLEGAIGAFCFATPWLFELVERAYVAVHPGVEGSPWLIRLARFALSMMVLLPPTMLMGGTLPALTRALLARLDQVGGRVATLYGINTIGAMVGASAAGFLLIPTVGIRQSVYLAAVLNLGVALVAWALSMVWEREAEPETEPEPEPQEEPAEDSEPLPPIHPSYAWLLVAYGLCGAASMVYEVGWTRVLSLALGTSTYAFSAMLAAFLAGIGLGSLVLAGRGRIAVDRLARPLLWFGMVELGIGVLVTALTPALDHLPFAFLALFRATGPRFWLLQVGGVGISLLVMLPPALLMGYAFPLVTRLATEHLGVVGRRVGTVYAANTVGTVFGSVAAGFLLIPAIGVRYTLAVGVALNLVVGAAYVIGSMRRAPRPATVGLAVAGLAALSWLVLPGWNRAVLTSGAYIYPGYYLAGPAQALMEAKEVLYYRDALTATVSVTRVTAPVLPEPIVSLQVSGKTDASTGDLSTQLLLAHLPALTHAEARSGLVVGLASGCTLGALQVYPDLERIDCVEIEPAMVEASAFFRDINRDCLDDPRTRLMLDDARNFLLVSRERYDIITSEPSNPWISGVANLFTHEYFTLCREHLTDSGLFCQWIPLYNLAPDDLACILGTFSDVFPECSLWMFPELTTDAFLVGTREPMAIDVVSAAARARDPEVAGDLRAAGVRDLWDLLAGYLFGAEVIAPVAQGARRNTDDQPTLEFTSPMRLHTAQGRLTTQQVLALAVNSSVPVGRCFETQPDAAADRLSGLHAAAWWSAPERPRFSVSRNPATYMSVNRASAVRCRARVTWRLGAGRAEVCAFRRGMMPPTGVPAEPDREPDRALTIGGDTARVWLAPGLPDDAAWMVRWPSTAADRTCVIVAFADAGPPPSPEEALRTLVWTREEDGP